MRRKNIALFTAQPEATHEIRIINGIATQCKKYGYNFLVFSPMTHLEFKRSAYVEAETNIYRAVNFDKIDGLILDAVNLVVGEGGKIVDELLERLKDYPDLPVVSLEMSIGDLPMIKSDNEEALREMCRHAIEIHGKKDICVLTGPKENEVAESRLKVCLDEIKKHGIEVSDEHIIYGDFWYSSGDDLARKFAEKKISLPEAVLCTSTHMALGLIYRLRQLGIKVPDDLIVIGFDTTNEGYCNDVILSAFDAADASSAAETVDHIRRIIDPGKEILPFRSVVKDMFFPGMSCGCEPKIEQSLSAFRRVSYLVAYNSAADNEMNEISFGRLMESYCLEEFTASGSADEFFEKMGEMIYLLKPFGDYQLCLREDWLNESVSNMKGYPSVMMIALSAKTTPDHEFEVNRSPVFYDTAEMTTLLKDEDLEPSIFYFSPIHFEGFHFGYSVIRRSLEDPSAMTLVYRTWLRFVNNALEMTRTRKQLMSLSVRDSMTGLFNRRGMNLQLENMLCESNRGKTVFAAVIDMDGLKLVNDTYGHSEGDYGIMLLCEAVSVCALPGEISVRAGGDEFFIIGVGAYDPERIAERKNYFHSVLDKLQSDSQKPFKVTASIGFATETLDENTNIDLILSRADKEMYEEKVRNKATRNR
ncbi:MAG: GGDEF domain-containing protein [Lachnospiraceae bacterium]|nr:GGDEF domain-containing protein [Lachnospiraceae bacterium]